VGAYGGARKIMKSVAPAGSVYQAGTLSGNPLATAAGLATLKLLDAAAYRKLENTAAAICEGLMDAAGHAGIGCTINRVGSMWTLFFTEDLVEDFAGAMRCDTKQFGKFFHAMLERGVYLPPSQFEAWFCSTAHDDKAVNKTLKAARAAFKCL
jgi:glutamate-1-semialdehyde 2,1-aminomutase